MKTTDRTRSAFTLLEIMVGLALLTMIGSILYTLMLRSSSHTATQTTIADLDSQCRQILAEISRDIRESDAITYQAANSSLLTGTHWVTTRIALTKVQGFNPFAGGGSATYSADGTVTWSSALLETGTANGVDNDRDGLIDQSAIQRQDNTGTRRLTTRGTTRLTGPPVTWPPAVAADAVPRWANNLRPPAIYFAFTDPDGPAQPLAAGPLVTVVVTLQGVDSNGRPLVRTLTAKVSIRN